MSIVRLLEGTDVQASTTAATMTVRLAAMRTPWKRSRPGSIQRAMAKKMRMKAVTGRAIDSMTAGSESTDSPSM